MSPALLDPPPDGQTSDRYSFNSFGFFPSPQNKQPMNPSSNIGLSGDSASGFSNSIQNKSRPRLVKHRKQMNSRTSKPGHECDPVEGFKLFQPVTESLDPNPSGSGTAKSAGNEPFVFGANRSYMGGNLNDRKWDSGVVMEEMKNLKIGSGNEFVDCLKKVPSFDQNVALKLTDEMGKLNIKGRKSERLGNTARGSTISKGVGSSFVRGMETELLNELKTKLKIKVNKTSAGSSGDALAYKIKNLSIKDEINEMKPQKKGGFVSTSSKSTGYLGGEREQTLCNETEEKLNIGRGRGCSSIHTDAAFFPVELSGKDLENEISCDGKFQNIAEAVRMEFRAHDTSGGSQKFTDQPKDDIKASAAAAPTSSVSSSDLHFQSGRNAFGMTSSDIPERMNEFNFTTKQDAPVAPFVESKTSSAKANIFSGINKKLEFSAKREAGTNTFAKRRKGKMKQPTPVQLWVGQDFVSKASGVDENAEPSESYSPMDVSPSQETLADTQSPVETSMASDVAFNLDNKYSFTGAQLSDSHDATDDDLVSATQRMDINEGEVKCEGIKADDSPHVLEKGTAVEVPGEDSISGAETESFKSAAEEIDLSDTAISPTETEASSSFKIESQDSDAKVPSGFPSNSEHRSAVDFTFAASSHGQSQMSAQKRLHRKKSSSKTAHDSYSSSGNMRIPYMQFSPYDMGSSLLSSGMTHNEVSPSPSKILDQSVDHRRHEIKHKADSSSATTAAEEACEKWRLRGNQAYTSGELSKAEDCYTQGINCVSQIENCRNSVRALMLCYSNRAATRISLGRMRDALRDCMMAAAIDPNFLKVQVRAANCYLALGEVEDASIYFRKCLHSGSNICVDRKIAVEASDGLQKTQKVSECLSRSAELLQRGMSDDAKSALEAIDEALLISLYSEKLLKIKAQALFKLHKYEKVIQLCEQTLDSAEKNSPLLDANRKLADLDCSTLPKDYKFRVWRWHYIFKSYFYLGRLDEAISSLQKQEELQSVTRDGNNSIESSIPLAATARELLCHKAAGNEAFQAGRHAEAIEHYTAAISCSVESRPFAAICFCNCAAAYKALGQITDAIADCSMAIAFDGNYVKAISRRATLYEMIRDYDQAATDLQRLIHLLTKKIEERANQLGASDRSMNLANDLRQARLHLSEIEEEAKWEVPLDMYLILGVECSASAPEIKKAYRKAALRHHPDKAVKSLVRSDNGDDGLWKEIGEEAHKDADKLFKMIGEAHAVLSEPTKRSQYDLEEEIRNAQKKCTGSTSRAPMDAPNCPFDRSASRRQWREVWKSYGNAASRASETTRSYRYP